MTRNLRVINGLRGVAILLVIFHHVYGGLHIPLGSRAWNVGWIQLYPWTILSNATDAVSLFFVLSGFVLFLPYAGKHRTMTSYKDGILFIKKRLLRLLPLLCVGGIVAVLLSTGFHMQTFLHGFQHYIADVLWPFPNGSSAYFFVRYNWVLWSLRTEIWLSLLMPLLVFAVQKQGIRFVLISTLIMTFLWRISAIQNWQAYGFVFSHSFLGRLDQFVLGMTTAWIYVHEKNRVPSWQIVTSFLLILAVFSFADYRSHFVQLPSLFPLQFLALNCALAAFVGSVVSGTSSFFQKILSHPILEIPGILCYSLYVWHGALFKTFHPTTDGTSMIIYLTVVFLLSLISYHLIERGNLLRRLQNDEKIIRNGIVIPVATS